MFDQVFAFTDLPKIFFLAFLEIILSADNAIVLSVLASTLEQNLRAKALYIGLISAFFIRAGAVVFLSFFIHFQWIQILGACYLLFLSAQYFQKRKKSSRKIQHQGSFWKTVAKIELFDLIFALDSILAGVAFISSHNKQEFHSKLWIVYFGGMIGLLAIRFAAHLYTRFIAKFPNMEKSAYLLIAWIAIKLIYELFPHPILFEYLFWGIFIILFLYGFIKSRQHVK